LFQRHSNEGWAIYQCTFGDAMQLVVMIDYSEAVSDFSKRLDGALIIVGAESYVDKLGFASYLDVSIEGIWDSGSYKGAIPCRSIWDGFGKRLAGVLLFSTV
jgi:diphthine-ammonia ligase